MANHKSKISLSMKILIGTVVLVLILFIIWKPYRKSSDPEITNQSNQTFKSDSSNKRSSNWEIDSTIDKMSDEKIFVWYVYAKSRLFFGYPFKQGSTATFVIREQGKETAVYLTITKGQFEKKNNARLRFDKGAVKTYKISNTENLTTIYFNSEKEILSNVKDSKLMIIEVGFYKNGTRQIEFDIEGLDSVKHSS